MTAPAGFPACEQPLMHAYDVALLDLDGVVNVGDAAVPAAPRALAAARESGMTLAFVTNNASRRPERVAERLHGFGVPAAPREVVTSAQAGARLLREHLAEGSRVYVCGAEALTHEVLLRGLDVVDNADDRPHGVVQGYSPDLAYPQFVEAALAIQNGALWVATNTDRTIPSPRGLLPGNGSLVAMVAHATGADPLVAGKPHPALHLESMERTGARRPLIVGDRLDTDIEGAVNAGCDSLLVLTGTTTPAALIHASPQHRPTYIDEDVAGLGIPQPEVKGMDGFSEDEDWKVAHDGTKFTLRYRRLGGHSSVHSGDGAAPTGTGHTAARVGALRVLCAAVWSAPPSVPGTIEAGDERSRKILDSLGL